MKVTTCGQICRGWLSNESPPWDAVSGRDIYDDMGSGEECRCAEAFRALRRVNPLSSSLLGGHGLQMLKGV
jgi:hypothetical protein